MVTYTSYLVYINDMIVAVEAAKESITVGHDTVSGSMFADDSVGTSERAEGLQKRTGTNRENTITI